MKVGITGGNSGIGKAIMSRYAGAISFSRSNGYDINTRQDAIIDGLDTCEIFVNNAHSNYAQVDLLYKWFERYKDTDKTIINISSNSSDGNKNKPWSYSVHKAALDKAVKQLQSSSRQCRIINIKPGYVDTPRVENVTADKIDPERIADLILWLLEDNGFDVETITVVPCK